MSKSFKKVVACMLAVLMVAFSVPFTALADGPDTTVYTPDVRLQFGTYFDANTGTWVENVADKAVQIGKGKNSNRGDFGLSGLKGPQLVATGSVSDDAKYTITGLKIEKNDIDNLLLTDAYAAGGFEVEPLDEDYELGKGDTFTVTIRMDGLSKVFVATSEIAYSDNIEPVSVITKNAGKTTEQTNIGTASQLGTDLTDAFADSDAQALYDNINSDEIGSVISTDYDGQNYMYAEVVADGNQSWSPVNKEDVMVIDEDTEEVLGTALIKEDGTDNATYANQSVMATFTFALKENISAENPIEFWVHNGNTDAHAKADSGADKFSQYAEGSYAPTSANDAKSNQTTYSANKFASATLPWGAAEENFGSKKMTFMGKNENVETPPATSYNVTFKDLEGETIGEVQTVTDDSEIVYPTITDAAYDTTQHWTWGWSDAEVDASGNKTFTLQKNDVANHVYQGTVKTPATHFAPGVTTYTCDCGYSYDDNTTPAQGEHNYVVPTDIAWDGEDKVTATVTLKCDADSATTTVAATVDKSLKSAATCTEAAVYTYTASYTGIDSISKDVSEGESLGHNYKVNSFTWTDGENISDAPTAVANLVCENNSEHTDTKSATVALTDTKAATEDEDGYYEYTATYGTDTDTHRVTIPATQHTHNYTIPVSIEWDGEDKVTATVTLKCYKDAYTTTVPATVESVKKSDATCQAAAVYTYTASYDGLDSISKDVSVGEPAAHTLTPVAEVPATCTADGTEAYWTCSECHKMFSDEQAQNEITEPVVIPSPGHNWGEWTVTTQPTAKDAGEETRECSKCHTKETRPVAALGVNITIPKFDIGVVKIGDTEADGTAVVTENFAYNASYTVQVTDGADNFVGWEINGKIASTNTSFTSTAFVDTTITPVFVDKSSTDTITVEFYDMYGNKVKEFKDVSVDDYQAAVANEVPTASNYPSATFKGWTIAGASVTDDDVKAINTSTTLWAEYENIESVDRYTVTVENATNDTVYDFGGYENGQIPYNTKVTVSDENAKGWKIGDAVVSNEDSYTFYVGADVTITMLTSDAESEPAATIIGANLISGSYRYNIVATRTVPEGCTLVDYGFVYGMNMNEDDLVLENEGKTGTKTKSGKVKVVRGATANAASNEFALNYGVKGAGATVNAKAFVVVKKGSDIVVKYSDMITKDSVNP
ncbi:MAG: hypothetical protein IJS03_01695 [Eubacterium sp.]|nr:hypothetical protein [Eubacterium sp.]